jgi:hypothetical protein
MHHSDFHSDGPFMEPAYICFGDVQLLYRTGTSRPILSFPPTIRRRPDRLDSCCSVAACETRLSTYLIDNHNVNRVEGSFLKD